MNLSYLAFDKLLTPLYFGGSKTRLIDGYRQLISNQDSQDEILASFDMRPQLLPFERNSFTEFSHNIYASPIEKLSGKLEPKIEHVAAPQSADAHFDKLNDKAPKRPQKNSKNRSKKETLESLGGSQTSQQLDRIGAPNPDNKHKSHLSGAQAQHSPKQKMAKLRLSSDLVINSTTSKARYPVIDAAAASAELNKRMSALGRQADWSTHNVGSRKLRNIDFKNHSQQAAGHISEQHTSLSDTPLLSQDIGAELIKKSDRNTVLSSESVFDKKVSHLNEFPLNDWAQNNKKHSALARITENQDQNTQLSIEKKLLSKLDKLERANNSGSRSETTIQSPTVGSSATKKVPSTSQGIDAARTIKQLDTISTNVGGLRGLAALATKQTELQGQTELQEHRAQQDTSKTNQANTKTANLIQKDLPASNAEKRDNLANDLAKSLAEEARRAGIDLEEFQP